MTTGDKIMDAAKKAAKQAMKNGGGKPSEFLPLLKEAVGNRNLTHLDMLRFTTFFYAALDGD